MDETNETNQESSESNNRKFSWKKLSISILWYVLCCILGGALITLYQFLQSSKIPQKQEITISENRPYELSLIKEDLQTYGRSKRISGIILKSIEETSKEFRLPIGLMHAIFRVESDYKFMTIHPTVNVPVKGKIITTNAIGLGGILWCYWGDSLRVKGIAEDEMELGLPDINIRASGYILRYLIDDEMSKKNLSANTILSNVVTRYYGAYSSLYLEKMERVTSDLWMRRIAKDLIKTSYKSKK